MTAPVVLIGTGPPMLLEGLARAQAGEAVLFVDRDRQIGGAWKTPERLGFAAVETGVHIIENRRALNAVFERLLPPEALIRSPPDYALWGRGRLPMRAARPLLYGLTAAKTLLAGKPDRFCHALAQTMAASANITVPLLYPKGGIATALSALTSRLAAAGARFEMGCSVLAVQPRGDGLMVLTEAGPVQAGHLVMSLRAHAPVEGVEPQTRRTERKTVQTLLLHLASDEGQRPVLCDGYVEIFGNAALKRVRNLGRLTTPAPRDGCGLIGVQIRPALHDLETDPLVARIVAQLKTLALVAPDAQLLGVSREIVPIETLAPLEARAIEKQGAGRITILPTVDLSDRRHPLPDLSQSFGAV